jgi:hypothetical protein
MLCGCALFRRTFCDPQLDPALQCSRLFCIAECGLVVIFFHCIVGDVFLSCIRMFCVADSKGNAMLQPVVVGTTLSVYYVASRVASSVIHANIPEHGWTMSAAAECMCNQCVQAAFLLQEHITERCVICGPAPFVRGDCDAPCMHKLLCCLCCD